MRTPRTPLLLLRTLCWACLVLLMLLGRMAWGQQAAAPGPIAPLRWPADFQPPPPDGRGQSLATRWPIVLSHAYSLRSVDTFLGDRQDPATGRFDTWGVKAALEAGGAIVIQPDKVAYGSNEDRGRLLYKRCAGRSLQAMLCNSASPVVVDGLHQAIAQYCAVPAWRQRSGLRDEADCRQHLKFNVICHSQGCLDSRYMMAAVRNEHSGELMYRHVASWTSFAGANKGTAQADKLLAALSPCFTPSCQSLLANVVLGSLSWWQDEQWVRNANASSVALSRQYVLVSTDMTCTPSASRSCPPSFNQRYPFPVDPAYPVHYQSFTSLIRDINHPCYRRIQRIWQLVHDAEGDNDGNISVDSQAFVTYGEGGQGGRTPVVARWTDGTSLDPSRPHPGLTHMAYSNVPVPGMSEGALSCAGEDNSAWRYSRVGFYRDVVAELVGMGH